MNSWALLGHILSGFVLFAGITTAVAGWEAGRRAKLPGEMAALLRLCRIGALTVAVATPLTLGFGLWLVDLQGRSLGDRWITWAIVLLVVAAVTGAAGGQRPKRARKLAEQSAAGGGAVPPELSRLLADRTSAALNYLAAACILGIVYLMVFKPT